MDRSVGRRLAMYEIRSRIEQRIFISRYFVAKDVGEKAGSDEHGCWGNFRLSRATRLPNRVNVSPREA